MNFKQAPFQKGKLCISQIKDEHLPAYGDPQNSLKLSGQTGAKVFSLLLTNTQKGKLIQNEAR